MARTSGNSPKKRGKGKSRVKNTQVESSKAGRRSRGVVQGNSDDNENRPVSDEEPTSRGRRKYMLLYEIPFHLLRIAHSHARCQGKSSSSSRSVLITTKKSIDKHFSPAWTPKATSKKRKPKDLEDENPTKKVRSKGGDKSRDSAEKSQGESRLPSTFNTAIW